MRVPFGELPGNGEIGAEMRDADGKERGSETERERLNLKRKVGRESMV
jgi:hypothetical protein